MWSWAKWKSDFPNLDFKVASDNKQKKYMKEAKFETNCPWTRAKFEPQSDL